jgi:hypothetical protein
MHGLGAEHFLTWNEEAVGGSDGAQAWADRGVFEHSDCFSLSPPAGPAGENLFTSSTSEADSIDSDVTAHTDAWYSEVEYCDWTKGCQQPSAEHEGEMVGHFTAMIWKATSEIACGYAQMPAAIAGGTSTLSVCRYLASPPNFGSTVDYLQQVPQRVNAESEATCEAVVTAWMEEGGWTGCALGSSGGGGGGGGSSLREVASAEVGRNTEESQAGWWGAGGAGLVLASVGLALLAVRRRSQKMTTAASQVQDDAAASELGVLPSVASL